MYGSQSTHAYHSACLWPTALKLGCVTNLDTLFLVMGSMYLIDEIQFMLIRSRHVCIRSITPELSMETMHFIAYHKTNKGGLVSERISFTIETMKRKRTVKITCICNPCCSFDDIWNSSFSSLGFIIFINFVRSVCVRRVKAFCACLHLIKSANLIGRVVYLTCEKNGFHHIVYKPVSQSCAVVKS